MYVLTAPTGSRRRRRTLGQIPGTDLVTAALTDWYLGTPPKAPSGAVSTPGLLYNWLASGLGIGQGCMPWDITCANVPAMIQAEQDQIQSVADNAAYYYGGPSSPVAVVAQTVANAQKSQAPNDVATLTASNLPVGPLSIPWWFWIALAGGAYLVVKR